MKKFAMLQKYYGALAEGDSVFSPEILIYCPIKHRPVSTGLKTEWVVFRSLPPVAIPLSCPACGHVHKWKPVDAWVGPPP
jgi:hypothetical protein